MSFSLQDCKCVERSFPQSNNFVHMQFDARNPRTRTSSGYDTVRAERERRRYANRWEREPFIHHFHGLPGDVSRLTVQSRRGLRTRVCRIVIYVIYCHSQRRQLRRRRRRWWLCCGICNRFCRSLTTRVLCTFACFCFHCQCNYFMCVHGVRHYDWSHILGCAYYTIFKMALLAFIDEMKRKYWLNFLRMCNAQNSVARVCTSIV